MERGKETGWAGRLVHIAHEAPRLRLVRPGDGDDADALPDTPPTVRVEISVNPQQLTLIESLLSGILTRMGAPSVSVAPPRPLAQAEPVAGRIDASPSLLQDAVTAWLNHLASKGRKPNTIRAFRQFIDKATRERGWSDVRDLTFQAIDGYMADNAAGWKGVTYKRNLTIFRSLCRYLLAAKLIDEDPLTLATSPANDGGAGVRATTTKEARQFLELVSLRRKFDARASDCAHAYFACLWLAGCRYDEPARWRWEHVHLDEPIPFIVWEPEISKNHRRQVVAIAPELAEILRAHRKSHGVSDSGTSGPRGSDPVFVEQPSRTTIRAYRDELCIPAKDAQGRPWSAHSARKWHATELAKAGVHERMIDHLMRHVSSVQSRYFDPSLLDQRAALALLPRLVGQTCWESEKIDTRANGVVPMDNESRIEESERMTVDGIPDLTETLGVVGPTRSPTNELHSTPRVAPKSDLPGRRHSANAGAMRDDRVEMKAVGKGRSGTSDGSVNSGICLQMPRGGLEPPTSGL